VTATAIDRPPLQDNLTESDAQARAALLSNLSYEVSLVLSDDPHAETFQSATTIVFDAAHEGSETFINIAARSIDECTLNGKRLTETQHGFNGHVLWLRGLRAGSNRLLVIAQCEYQHTGVGLHRLRDPVDDEVYVYTHFEPFDAHKVLACFDQPDLKAGVTMSVTAPSAWRVCGNGRLLRTEPRGALKTWHFNTTPPLPPYLIAVVAGKYHVVERKHRDIPMGLWCRESLATWVDAQADEIFEITASGLDFFERYFGLKYPFDEYNQLFVPEFNMGAMENPGCVTFNEAYIHRGRASEAQLQRRAETILHEMAHVHGFGDVTTMRWWGDLWLNETFATYMANLAMEKSTRFTNAWVDFANSVKSIAARQDQLVTTHRIADHVPDTVSVRQNFDGITYHKGAAVMRQLVAWVGDDAFMRGVQDYFKRYRWGNADLQQFLDCLRRASGRDLTRWGQDWLQTTGLNTFHAHFSKQNGQIYGLRGRADRDSGASDTARPSRRSRPLRTRFEGRPAPPPPGRD
jgi:aminopeptidase N